ncbi:unnamed protein product [Soboliphyme baturini]|uniref:Uncharacterized protein n=1 Tax=Soboliphyme baturini TaxID=241478 RepID=A0A183IPD9_9BILA|nr:unnamed protein product [Soboliphyme baturini]
MGSAATKCNSSFSQSCRSQVHVPHGPEEFSALPAIDKRLPFTNYREWYSLKNYWKTVQRNKEKCAKLLLYRYSETFSYEIISSHKFGENLYS